MPLTAADEIAFYEYRKRAIENNGARNARSIHRLTSRGTGQTRLPNPLKMQLTFVEQPTFTSGVTLKTGALIDGAYPVANVGVYKWQIDARGFYIGAYVWVASTFGSTQLDTLDSLSTNVQRQTLAEVTAGGAAYFAALDQMHRAQALNAITLEHHLCFEGYALRDVNIDKIFADS